MIVAVCLNPAIDVTYLVDSLRPGTSHTVTAVHRRAGGKAINTARVLAQLGEQVTLCGFAGGPHGARLRADLVGTDVQDALTPIDGETRQSVTVVDDTDATVLNEPGPTVTAQDWTALLDTVTARLQGCAVIVMSGSVPPGAPADAYAQLVRLARKQEIPAVVDATGRQLRHALAAGPAIVAPNREELADTLGAPAATRQQLIEATAELSRRTGAAAVVSAGWDGLVAVAAGQRWTARPPRLVAGNPTGAGDALTAALARGLARGVSWPERLADAVALAAAAVSAPVAGHVDLAVYRAMLAETVVEELH